MTTKKKLAIITTHPVQYYAPWFQLMAKSEKIDPKVFYTWEKNASLLDEKFGKEVVWDIPLLSGYTYVFVSNGGNTNRGFWDLKNPGLNKAIEEWGADAILIFGWNYYSHLKAMLYFKKKIPVIFRGDSTVLNDHTGIKKILRKIWLSWVYRHIDYALYVGINNKNYYLEYGLHEKQLFFAPHAIDNARFIGQTGEYDEKAKQWRASLGIKDSDTVFLFAGKLYAQKDPGLLIEAFIALKATGTALIVVGNGELESTLKQKYSAISNIHFLDFQNQTMMPVVYRLGNIFVLPSAGETWGLAVNEAMACGRAIIVSDQCGCAADLVKENINGYIFKSGDREDLKDCLHKAMKKPGLLGSQSSQIIRSWSYGTIVKALEEIIDFK